MNKERELLRKILDRRAGGFKELLEACIESETYLQLIDRIPEKVKPNPIPTVHRVVMSCNCRKCFEDFDLLAEPKFPADGLDLEIIAHEALEEAGWVDGLCPKCFQAECGY